MESALIEGLRQGDFEAFNHIYDLYAHKLLGYAIAHINSESEAEDLVQEVFISLWKNRQSIKCSIKSYLFTALKKRIISSWRTTVQSQMYTDYVELMELNISDSGIPPIEYTEFCNKVSALVNSLPATQREVIRLSRFENLSYPEIAERLGLTHQSVKNALSKGLSTLRKYLPLYLIVINLLQK